MRKAFFVGVNSSPRYPTGIPSSVAVFAAWLRSRDQLGMLHWTRNVMTITHFLAITRKQLRLASLGTAPVRDTRTWSFIMRACCGVVRLAPSAS